jgi:hypothetical protein
VMALDVNGCTSSSGPGPRSLRDEAAEIITRLPLFLSSYAPLFVIFAVRFDQPEWVRLVCIGLAVLGFVAVGAIVRAVRALPSGRVKVGSVKDAGAEAGGYLATYVLPFVSVSSPSNLDMIGYGIFMLVLALIYVRSELVQINPIVYLLLMRVVKVKTTTGEDVYVIARGRPRSGDELALRSFAGVSIVTRRGAT